MTWWPLRPQGKAVKKIQFTCSVYKLNFKDTMASFLRENLHRSN
jgi:hypothetical protein